MTKPSLQDALNNTTQKKLISFVESLLISKEGNRSYKKLIVEIPSEAHYQIDKMRLDMRRTSIKELVIEGLNDLFKKHGYPPIA